MVSYIFDVDGTLTESRKKIDPEFANWLEMFMTHNACYIVTGSDREKTIEQVGKHIYNLCVRVYNCSGNDVYEQEKNIRRNEFYKSKELEEYLEYLLQRSEFPDKTGKHLEYRPGLLNFSILGRNATPEQRAKYVEWDKKTNEREYYSEALKHMFPQYQHEVAGDTGIDITGPKGNKSQIISDFDLKNDHIYFFGDKMEPGGNDYLLSYALATKGHTVRQVKKWEDTWEFLKKL